MSIQLPSAPIPPDPDGVPLLPPANPLLAPITLGDPPATVVPMAPLVFIPPDLPPQTPPPSNPSVASSSPPEDPPPPPPPAAKSTTSNAQDFPPPPSPHPSFTPASSSTHDEVPFDPTDTGDILSSDTPDSPVSKPDPPAKSSVRVQPHRLSSSISPSRTSLTALQPTLPMKHTTVRSTSVQVIFPTISSTRTVSSHAIPYSTSKQTSLPDQNSKKAGKIVLGVLGIIVLFAILGSFFTWIYRRTVKRRNDVDSYGDLMMCCCGRRNLKGARRLSLLLPSMSGSSRGYASDYLVPPTSSDDPLSGSFESRRTSIGSSNILNNEYSPRSAYWTQPVPYHVSQVLNAPVANDLSTATPFDNTATDRPARPPHNLYMPQNNNQPRTITRVPQDYAASSYITPRHQVQPMNAQENPNPFTPVHQKSYRLRHSNIYPLQQHEVYSSPPSQLQSRSERDLSPPSTIRTLPREPYQYEQSRPEPLQTQDQPQHQRQSQSQVQTIQALISRDRDNPSPTPSMDSDTPPSYMSGGWASNLRQKLFDRVMAEKKARLDGERQVMLRRGSGRSKSSASPEQEKHVGSVWLVRREGPLRVVNGMEYSPQKDYSREKLDDSSSR
ncbi:hypothetical protein M422DRAFT_239377 [Sphaerobolus stellatus SS14]|nr:hypothetical protein M422DRAFT_239377 [Sphaerobolus stellatus SS14]